MSIDDTLMMKRRRKQRLLQAPFHPIVSIALFLSSCCCCYNSYDSPTTNNNKPIRWMASGFTTSRAINQQPRFGSCCPFHPSSSHRRAYHGIFHGNTERFVHSLLFLSDSPDDCLASSSTSTSTTATTTATTSNNNNNNNNTAEKESWSRRASSSPLQVRNRVRAVLQRARDRTGIRNSSCNDDDDLENNNNNLMDSQESPLKQGLTTTTTTTTAATATIPEQQGNAITIRENDDIFTFSTIAKKNGATDPANGSLLQYLTQSLSSSSSSSIENQTNDSRNNKPSESVIARSSSSSSSTKTPSDNNKEVAEPLPFTLPTLTETQLRLLAQGERIQEQSKMGNEGSGYVVVDVKAPPYVVWECLLDFESYPETIPTVRDMKLFTSTHLQEGYPAEQPVLAGTGRETRHYGIPSVTRAAFVLSKFRLNIAAIHTYQPHPHGHYMIFTLDPSCTNVVLQSAKGIWYTQPCPEREDYTRVWLLCELKVSWALPSFIVDYAAKRAMPRATTWLKPQVEAAAELWLKERP